MGRRLFERLVFVLFGASIATAVGIVAFALTSPERAPEPEPDPRAARLATAAACNCALVRFEIPAGVRVGTVRRVTALDKTWTVRAPDLGATTERWLGDEVLLPAGVYVVTYHAGGREHRLVVESKGPNDHKAIAIPRPESAPGFSFVPGGACGRDGTVVAPFLLAEHDTPDRFEWPAATAEADRRGEDVPTAHELACAIRLELVDQDRPRWVRGDDDSAPTVARGLDAFIGPRAARATLRSVRPVSTIVARFAVGHPVAASAVQPIADAMSAGRYLELVGRTCSAVNVVNALAAAGVPATAIWIRDAGPTSDVVANVHSAPPAGARRADYVLPKTKPCPGKFVFTDTAVEILDVIQFAPGTARLLPVSHPVLDAVAATLLGNPAIQLVEVQSHAFDAPHSERLELSNQRASVVTAYLIAKGVARERLTSQGYGDTQPLGCPVELEQQLRARLPIEQLRAGGAWSDWADDQYVLGTLDQACLGASARNTRMAFLILKRSSD